MRRKNSVDPELLESLWPPFRMSPVECLSWKSDFQKLMTWPWDGEGGLMGEGKSLPSGFLSASCLSESFLNPSLNFTTISAAEVSSSLSSAALGAQD